MRYYPCRTLSSLLRLPGIYARIYGRERPCTTHRSKKLNQKLPPHFHPVHSISTIYQALLVSSQSRCRREAISEECTREVSLSLSSFLSLSVSPAMQETIKKNGRGNGSAGRDGLRAQPRNEFNFSNKTRSWHRLGIHNDADFTAAECGRQVTNLNAQNFLCVLNN